jgi:hypothetical protein
VVRIDVAEGWEDELDRWYDEEHIPEKLGIEGFLSARRYRDTGNPRRNLVVYDLADPSAADVRVAATPWTLRIKESWAALDRGVYRALGPTSARPAGQGPV